MRILTINGKEISLEALIQKIKGSGRTSIIKPLVEQVIIEKIAAEKQIKVNVEELQEGFDAFRKSRGFYTTVETQRWMGANFINLDELEKDLENKILAEKIKDSFPWESVEKYFAENKAGMDAADISMLTVKEEEVAMELLTQIKEEEADFMVLAREYSIDEQAKVGGYLGTIQRFSLKDHLRAAIFGAEPGDVVGPFEMEQGYRLIKVNAIYSAVLDEQKEKEIRNILFQNLIAEEQQKVEIDWVV